jgi:hypothetical protein
VCLVAFGAVAGTVAGCSGDDSAPAAEATAAPPACPTAARASWQKLANEIDAATFCPSWLPQPLVGKFSGRFFNGRSVDPDRSYLVSFVWFESAGGLVQEVHVNLRGYPGTTKMPVCEDLLNVNGKVVRKNIPCFSDRSGQKRLGGRTVTVYTANQGADMWHVLYAWKDKGSLYTISEHVADPYTLEQVTGHLDRMTRTLVRFEPKA